MSRDYQLAWNCPHLTVEEVTSLAADRRSLPTRQPIANQGTVRILVNNEQFVPQAGLYSPAVLASANSGPFDLVEGEDTLSIFTHAKGWETFVFGIVGNERRTTDQIVKFLLNPARPGMAPLAGASVANSNGYLVFVDAGAVGTDSYVKVSGSMASALGFGDPTKPDPRDTTRKDYRPWAAQGSMLYPPWIIASRPIEGTTAPVLDRHGDPINYRFPMFTEAIRGNPVFKVTYAVPTSRCLRCGGSGIENDMRFDRSGQALMVENENLLYQAAMKILLTDKNSNPFQKWYGTDIRSRIGAKALGSVAAAISEDVRKALMKLQALQKGQAEYQQVTAKERLYAILQVLVRPHAQDPTTFWLDVTVQNASSDPVNLSVIFTVPEVVALMGSNGLFLAGNSGVTGQENLKFLPDKARTGGGS